MYNFGEKNWEKNCNQGLVIEELLNNFISQDNWYFVPFFNIEKALDFYRTNMTTNKHNETEIDDGDS